MVDPAETPLAVVAALAASPAPVALAASGRVAWANDACVDVSGRRRGDLLGSALRDLLEPEEDLRALPAPGGEPVEGPWSGVYRLVRPDGDVAWLSGTFTPLAGSGAAAGGADVLVQLTDVTSERRLQDELRHAATHDTVTGLPNRLLFTEHLAHAVARLRRDVASCVSVLYIDLDRFKHVNDTFGHAAGDELLASVARRLQSAVRPQDVVARLGGDEFAVLLEDLCDGAVAGDVARRVGTAISSPHRVRGAHLSVSASVGIALTGGPAGDRSPGETLAAADAAMYLAKANGGGRSELLVGPLDHRTPRAVLERQLHRALERDELEVHYQPIIDLTTGAVTDGEALLRWRHPDHGLLSAGEFIDIATESGLLHEIGEWVVETVCGDLHTWDGTGTAVEHVYLNVAGHQIRPQFVAHLAAALERHQLGADRLRVEITETELMSSEQTLQQLDALHRLGCSLVVDDFGTGYSSMARLIDLPVDVVKIDRSFIAGVGVDPRPSAVVSAALLLAHDLRQGVVAEGVETEDQRRWLYEAGCGYAQGFGIARPVPAEQFCGLASGTL